MIMTERKPWNSGRNGGRKGNDEGWTFLFYHDIKTPFLTIDK